MATFDLVIDTIFDGFMPSGSFGQRAEYLTAIGIDPDYPLTDASTDIKTSGAIRPVAYGTFSGSNVTSYPIAILTNPKDAKVYVVLKNGRLVSYSSSLGSETLVGTVAGSNAEGAFYYNNYIYITGTGASKDDVSRYGPLSNSPALVDNVWKGATLGSQTALVDNTYPTSLLSVNYLKHYGVVHIDNAAYFLDYKNGKGMVHKIATTKVTDEGDTNNGSSYDILDLPLNFLPMSISPVGINMGVSASFTTDSSIIQGRANLFLFNPADTTPSFFQQTELPDAICSVLKYVNGILYGFSGDISGGYRLFKYLGGDSIETLKIIEEGNPPLQGAVAAIADRIAFAADITFPFTASGLFAYGSKSSLFPRGLHNIAISPLT